MHWARGFLLFVKAGSYKEFIAPPKSEQRRNLSFPHRGISSCLAGLTGGVGWEKGVGRARPP